MKPLTLKEFLRLSGPMMVVSLLLDMFQKKDHIMRNKIFCSLKLMLMETCYGKRALGVIGVKKRLRFESQIQLDIKSEKPPERKDTVPWID